MIDDVQAIAQTKQGLSWLKQHERLLLVFVLLVVLAFLGNKWINYSAQQADRSVAVMQQVLVEQKQANAVLSAQVTATQIKLDAQIAAWTVQNKALSASIDASNASLRRRQDADRVLPLPELADRWNRLLSLPTGSLTASQTGVLVTDQGARATVNELERVPVLQEETTGLRQIIDNKDKQIEGQSGLLGLKDSQIDGLKKENADAGNYCKAEIAKVKADGRKSKRNWFIAGFVAGISTRLLGKF